MNVKLDSSWKRELEDTFNEPYFKDLVNFVRKEYSSFICYPPGNSIFSALDNCSLDDLKLVIIGQDPYHGKGQAHGYCFSVPEGIKIPPSLNSKLYLVAIDARNDRSKGVLCATM